MRFTGVLLMPQNLPRLRDVSWQRWRKRRIGNDGMAALLEKSGIEVIDANDFVERDSPLFKDYQSLPEVKPIFPEPLKNDSSHPLWKDVPAKVLNHKCFPMEGVKQAQLLTKSVQVKSGLPDAILEFNRNPAIEGQDAAARNVVQQAYLWDAHLDKQPRLRSLEIPEFRYKNAYGIKAETSTELLIRNLLRLCQAHYPKEVSRTAVAGGTDFRVNVEREGFNVQFQLSPLVTILSKHLLKPYSPVSATEDLTVPDVAPFNSVLNFEEEHIYHSDDFIGYNSDTAFPNIHTAVFAHTIPGSFTHVHPRWNSDRYSGSTLLYGFATALLMARRKFGTNINALPEPITTQTIHFTGKEWQFGVFQLNTLDLDDAEHGSTKNIAWLTPRISLFEKCCYDYDKGRAIFEGYNPEVFKLLFGMYTASTLEPLPELPTPEPEASSEATATSSSSPSPSLDRIQ